MVYSCKGEISGGNCFVQKGHRNKKHIRIFFCLEDDNCEQEKIILKANKLIAEYNKRSENTKKLVDCCKNNLKSWLSIPKRIKEEIKGNDLEKIFYYIFERKASYLKASQENFISETTLYSKTKAIFDAAINYMYYEHLFILDDVVIS